MSPGPPRCPYCAGLLDLKGVRPRDVKGFPCPACHRPLEIVPPHTSALIVASFLYSLLILWVFGLRRFVLAVWVFPLSLLIFAVESIVVSFFFPLDVKVHEGPIRDSSSHFLTLDIPKKEVSENRGERTSSSANGRSQ